jgi:BASS family bile acid:Na+ symporter
MPLDALQLNFNDSNLFALNLVLGLIMFGVALDLKLADFINIAKFPRAVLAGMLGQFVLLPALTFVLVQILQPAPSMALGMFLVAACPGGNVSNFLTHLGRGNTALSISMTAISTVAALIMTPLNFGFWAAQYSGAHRLLTKIALNPWEMGSAILLILGAPLALGLLLAQRYPDFAQRARQPMKRFSILVFALFIVIAFGANWQNFLTHVRYVAFAVFVQNALALAGGYFTAMFLGLEEKDRRAVAIEVGIQNSGLGLGLIFNFFGGLGGAALIAAWWGIWHLISGGLLALFWSRREPL